MQLYISMSLSAPMILPLNYRYQVQSALFGKLREVQASDFWHNEGFGEARKFKPFIFGELMGRHTICKENKTITFYDRISFEVRSIDLSFIENLNKSFDLSARFVLFDRILPVTEHSLRDFHLPENACFFKTATPVCVHQTLADGKTRYFSPEEPQFSEGLLLNFQNKYQTVLQKTPPEICITPTGTHKKLVTRYKGIWITAFSGTYEICAPHEALEFIYNVGLGEKNPQGFGLLKLISEQK